MISSDHGFSTISKESKTSPSAKGTYEDTPNGFLPMGFLAIDLAKALDLPLFDPNDKNAPVAENAHPKAGNGVLGKDPAKPDLVVATNGGSDLIYLPNKDRKLAGRTVKALLEQDYVSGLFVEDDLGRFPGALPLSLLGLRGKAVTPHPAIVVNFRSWSSGCDEPTNCSVEIADTVLRQGQGMHGSFSRGDTMNFMAAIGPDFKAGYVDALPVSNADVGATAAQLLGLTPKPKGNLIGRVMTEAMPNGATPQRLQRHHQFAAVGQRPADGAEIPARRRPALFRCGGISRAARSASRPKAANKKRRGNNPAVSRTYAADADRTYIPMSNTFGSCASGRVAAPTMVATSRHQGAVAAALAAHLAGDPFQHFGIDADGLGGRPALDRGIRRQRDGARRHRQAGRGGRVMHDRLGEQVVETSVVAALGGGVVDLEQRFGFGAADRLMLDRGRGQDARAPGGVIGIQRAGKMNAALGGRAFAGDDAVADDGERLRGGLAAGNLRGSTAAIGSADIPVGADIGTLLFFFF